MQEEGIGERSETLAEVERQPPVSCTVEDDGSKWGELPPEQIRRVEGCCRVDVELFTKVGLDGRQAYAVLVTSSAEMPHGMLGGHWGGGESFDAGSLEGIKKFFNELMQCKRQDLEQSYRDFSSSQDRERKHDYHNLYYEYRLVPAKNYFVLVGNQLKQLLLEKGFDFDKWYAEYKGLPEKIAGDEQKQAGEKILLLLKECGEVEKRIDAIEKVVEAQKSCASRLDLFGKTPEDVRSELLKEVGRLRCISEEIRKQREVIGESRYSRYTEFWHVIDKYKGEEKLQTTLSVAKSSA